MILSTLLSCKFTSAFNIKCKCVFLVPYVDPDLGILERLSYGFDLHLLSPPVLSPQVPWLVAGGTLPVHSFLPEHTSVHQFHSYHWRGAAPCKLGQSCLLCGPKHAMGRMSGDLLRERRYVPCMEYRGDQVCVWGFQWTGYCLGDGGEQCWWLEAGHLC